MNLLLKKSQLKTHNLKLQISGSKSETNRLLLLQALYSQITLLNTSNSDDSNVMLKALQIFQSDNFALPTEINVHHAGTAMRFLTAYSAIQEGKRTIITGSERMQQRPIKVLVDALRELDVTINYLKNDGFPPLEIYGQKITKNHININANVSSQYISSLILIAPRLENGLSISLDGEVTSAPYIKMTLGILNEIGVNTTFIDNKIEVFLKSFIKQKIVFDIESDWSSASYYYSMIALSPVGTSITVSTFKENSFQGDAILQNIYRDFGVTTTFDNGEIGIKKTEDHLLNSISLDLNNAPDLAQTIAVTCFGLGIACKIMGLHTLKIKETDRLEALQAELTKLGAEVSVTNYSLQLAKRDKIISNCSIATYNDHRMAMAFAPLALKTDIIIEDFEVVSKSYPNFWTDVEKIGLNICEVI